MTAAEVARAKPASANGMMVEVHNCDAYGRVRMYRVEGQIADADRDGDVDINDFESVQRCFSGEGNTIPAGCSAEEIARLDVDGDADIDEQDMNVFMACWQGPAWAVRATGDYDEDGWVTAELEGGVSDVENFVLCTQKCLPQDPQCDVFDFDGNGHIDLYDYGTLAGLVGYPAGTPWGGCVVAEGESRIGNPYSFTGRRLDLLERPGTSSDVPVQVYHYRARWYDPVHGRFGQRDPLSLMERPLQASSSIAPNRRPADSALPGVTRVFSFLTFEHGAIPRTRKTEESVFLYEYVQSAPDQLTDPLGLWGEDVHYDDTRQWAIDVEYNDVCAKHIANADDGVDDYLAGSSPMYFIGDFRYHFDTTADGLNLQSGARDGRITFEHTEARTELSGASNFTTVKRALTHVGRALHAMQDKYSHNAKHNASTPFFHTPKEHCKILDPLGADVDICIDARKNNKNWNNPHLPDTVAAWPVDHMAAGAATREDLKRWLDDSAVDCYCRSKK
ncbi:MAG: hypothetical protein H6816_04125 [Phycisphaerales bacterium]|nr:hypothetical protein [Phycisphaerales bacterium]